MFSETSTGGLYLEYSQLKFYLLHVAVKASGFVSPDIDPGASLDTVTSGVFTNVVRVAVLRDSAFRDLVRV